MRGGGKAIIPFIMPTLYIDKLKSNIEASIRAKQQFLSREDQLEAFGAAASLLVDCYKKGGRVYIAGNGGSAADAQHLAAEFVSKLARPRAPMPAEALTVDTSIITAIGNDFGFDEIFARQIAGKMQKGDVFLGITTSGHSRNILRALEQCRLMGNQSIVLTGWDGGKVKGMADHVLIASGNETSGIQELHIVILHTLCAVVEAEMFPA